MSASSSSAGQAPANAGEKAAFAKTLLLTGTAPATDGVGAIILADLCDFIPCERICVVHVSQGMAAAQDLALESGAAMRRLSVDYRRRLQSRFGRPGRALQWLAQLAGNRKVLREAQSDIVAWARQQGIEQVWAVLDSPLAIELAAPVAAQLGVPLRVTVWDDIHHNTRYFGLDRLTARQQAQAFAATLDKSVVCAVIGETMKTEYEALYGVRTVIVRHGLSSLAREDLPAAASDRQPLIIGFAGSVTAKSAFEALLTTLDRLAWSIDGKPVVLRLLGHRFDLKSRVARQVECYGWRSVDETVALLADCDFNYLPQPFEADWRPFARLSFPSKLSTYLAAGPPLLLHAPAGASLPAFLANYPFGEWCSALDSAELEQSMRRLLDAQRLPAYRQAAERALAEELSHSTFRARFAQFLDIPEGWLRQ